MDGVIIIDCGEEYSISTHGAEEAIVKQYKKNVLPVMAHYDDFGKLTVVSDPLFGEAEAQMSQRNEFITMYLSFFVDIFIK